MSYTYREALKLEAPNAWETSTNPGFGISFQQNPSDRQNPVTLKANFGDSVVQLQGVGVENLYGAFSHIAHQTGIDHKAVITDIARQAESINSGWQLTAG